MAILVPSCMYRIRTYVSDACCKYIHIHIRTAHIVERSSEHAPRKPPFHPRAILFQRPQADRGHNIAMVFFQFQFKPLQNCFGLST